MSFGSLPVFMAVAGRPVILLGEGPAADAKRRLLERAGAIVVTEDDEGRDARLAVVALQQGTAEAVARLRARGVLVNAVDRPELCDFTLPAIVDRAPVLVAIGTAGVSAGLAAALRQRLEMLLPAGLGRVAEALHAAREHLRALYPDAGDRRRAIAALLAEGGPLDLLRDHAIIGDRFATPDLPPDGSGSTERIVLTSPDPDELTLRAARLLAQADRVVHAPDMPAAVLDRARADAGRVVAPAGPAPGLTVEIVWGQR